MTSSLETREPNEAALIAEMTAILKRKMARDYAKGATGRDAHPKTPGLLRATFTVAAGLPPELRVGLFATPATYDCWVRTSNSSGKPQADAVPDARGIAIKLLASGKGKAADTPLGQDFVLLSAPTMPLGTVAMFRDAVFYTIESTALLLGAKLLLTGKAGALLDLSSLRIRPNSPLDIRYWSTTPYLFGKGVAVKYSLRPTSKHRSPAPATRGDDYLSEAMQAHLSRHVASFDFCVQLRKGDMPIEDAAVRWSERRSPFVKVATLHVPTQKFRSSERDALAEVLSFSPGHALPAHRPLGGLNRARIKIYKALSAFRHRRDGRSNLA